MEFDERDSVLYMKVGTHAQEGLSEIIARKRREIEQAGLSMWGYGGNTCHPTSMVQPFARSAPGRIFLCMQPMSSSHFAEPLRAEEFSEDGMTWARIPDGINVLGSRYALCIGSLDSVAFDLDLARTRVAVGNSMGRSGSDYVRGRVDKACLEITANSADAEPSPVGIQLVAEVVKPYAVFLRS